MRIKILACKQLRRRTRDPIPGLAGSVQIYYFLSVSYMVRAAD